MTEWRTITMLVDSQRPEYCPCTSEEEFPTCPVCPATVAGNDIVRGVCQAKKAGRPPEDWLELIVVGR